MKNLKEYIIEKKNESDNKKVYIVYFGDNVMDSYFYDEKEAQEQVDKLNNENPDAKAYYKEESKTKIEK